MKSICKSLNICILMRFILAKNGVLKVQIKEGKMNESGCFEAQIVVWILYLNGKKNNNCCSKSVILGKCWIVLCILRCFSRQLRRFWRYFKIKTSIILSLDSLLISQLFICFYFVFLCVLLVLAHQKRNQKKLSKCHFVIRELCLEAAIQKELSRKTITEMNSLLGQRRRLLDFDILW